MKIIIKTFQGLEEVLSKEITQELGITNIELLKRAVTFEGSQKHLYEANLKLRTALRVLVPLAKFKARDYDELYSKMSRIEWNKLMTPEQTFALDIVCYSKLLTNSRFVLHRSKDAIVDYFTKKMGTRPSVGRFEPDVKFQIHVSEDECTLLADSSGESLHIRGYRLDKNEAPMNEVLAAGLIHLSGWDQQSTFFDPMCGSGTLPIEAAMMAKRIPPRLCRSYYAFKNWQDFDVSLYDQIEALSKKEQQESKDVQILGADITIRNLRIAEGNAKRAGVAEVIKFSRGDFFLKSKELTNATLIINPPYGERIKEGIDADFYERIGNSLKRNFQNNNAWIIASEKEYIKKLGLRPSKKVAVNNGGIDCTYLGFELYEGTKKNK